MARYHLISFNLCPFVQRSIITLLEKEVPFELTYIDIKDKPGWFKRISPLGKVPVLLIGGDPGRRDSTLFESSVINEFIDETTRDPLMPAHPLERAIHRGWIEVASTMAGMVYQLMVATDETAASSVAAELRALLTHLEERLATNSASVDPTAENLFAQGFSLVDAAFAPVLQRLEWCEQLAPTLVLSQELHRVERYRAALLSRPSVKNSVMSDIRQVFGEYLKGMPGSWLGKRA